MEFQPIKGVIVPTLTPFDEQGALDTSKVPALIDYLIDHGVKGVFPAGTTGEGALLTIEERRQLAEATVKAVDNRISVIIHTGAITTKETIELSRHARDIGADAIAVVTPYYFKYSNEALEHHYRTVIEDVRDMPIYLYNIPQNTGNTLSLNLVMQLASSYSNVVGLKDSSGDLQTLFATHALDNGNFNTAIGPDNLILSGLAMGLDACVSGHANMVPEIVVGIYNAVVEGDINNARHLQYTLNQVSSALQEPRRLSIWKAVMEKRGIPMGGVRRPLLDATEDMIMERIKKLVALNILPSD